MTARLRSAAALMALSLLAGCAGPARRLDLGIKEVPSDIVLGSPESGAPAPAPVPPAVPVLVGPGLPPSFFPPTRSSGPTTIQPPSACPQTDPLAAPKLQATTRITEAPPQGALPYRVDGKYTVSGSDSRSGRFPADSTRTVSAVQATASGFTYQVAAQLAGTTTTTGYQVIKDSEVPGEAGLYVTFIATEAPSGATARFQPALPMKLVELPMIANNSVTAAGTDPISATTVSWSTTVRQKTRVAACGTNLDAITVVLDSGRVDSPQTNVDFSATYAIGTQFGGLSLADTVKIAGREGLDTVSRDITSTVSADPGRIG
jgi:hypothetical protein